MFKANDTGVFNLDPTSAMNPSHAAFYVYAKAIAAAGDISIY